MTTTTAPIRATDCMRDLLAFALATCDAENIPVWRVAASNVGSDLDIFLDAHGNEGVAQGRRLFAALGGHRHQEWRKDRTWSIYSSDWSEYAKRDYARPNVAFAGRMIEVHIACSVPEDDTTPPAADA